MRVPRLTSWWGPLALLAAVRVAIPLAVYAASPTRLPALPRFTRAAHDGGLTGDATGFYAAAREFMAAWGRMPRVVLALDALLALAAAVAIVVAWRRRPGLRPWLVAAALATFAVVVAVDVHWMKPTGAAVFGWSLVWALPMLAYRALGLGLGESAAWDIGLALSLAFVALTVVAVAYLGRHATGRRWAGLLAAAAWTAWPFLVGAIAGHHAWANGQWEIDAGLHNYDEPLSTLLVTAGAALLLSPRLDRGGDATPRHDKSRGDATPRHAILLVLAGAALSAATAVKVSNTLPAAAALVVVLLRGGRREALPYLAGALTFVPVVAVYWPLSYPKLYENPRSWPRDPFDAGHVVSSWTHSSIFSPHTLAIVVPLALVGTLGVRRPWALALVLAFLLLNPIFYSFYANTAEHPRFLYASLPELFVLWAAGVAVLVSLILELRAPAAPRPIRR